MIGRLAWATSAYARGHDPDEEPALAQLAVLGVPVDVVAWDDASVDWSAYDRVALRSTWGYQHRFDEFVAWLTAVDAVADLRNPLPMARWSLDKHYLVDLDRAGVPVIPTAFVEPGEAPPTSLRPGEVVVKPSIGASGSGVRVHREPGVGDGPADLAAHVAEIHAGGASALVQPRLASVDRVGEYPLVFLDGRFSHAARRRVVVGPDGDGRNERGRPYRADDRQVAVAAAAVAHVTERFGVPAYARVDLVEDDAGAPLVLEVELVEPSLFVAEGGPDAAARLAAALLA